MTTRRIFLASIITVSVIATGCGTASSQAAATATPPVPAMSVCPAAVFNAMTEAERVGQLFLVGIPVSGGPGAAAQAAIREHHFGSVLFSGDSTAGVAAISGMARRVQQLTGATAGVKFFVAANQEGGEVQELAGPGFAAIPSALTQGSLSPAALQRAAQSWGRELKRAGVNLDLAPVMDVVPAGTAAKNAPIGALHREFGDNPVTNGEHGAAFIRGMAQAGLATSAKHFPGLGRVRGNTDFTANVVDDQTTAHDPYLASFQAAINAGTPFVLVALATYTKIDPAHLAVFSSRIITGILRDQMHFTGVIMSDDLGEAVAVANLAPGTRAIDFLAAGGDLITSQTMSAADTMATAVLGRAESDAAFRADVSTAVMRVLRVKQSYGLLPCLPGVQ